MTNGARRNQIRQINTLWSMKEEGYLTEEEYQVALDQAETAMVFKSGIADADKWIVCVNEACDYEGIASTFVAEGSGHACPVCGKKINVFGKSHLDEIAAQFGLPVLARLPIDPAVAEAFDNGLMETVNTDTLNDAVDAVMKAERNIG